MRKGAVFMISETDEETEERDKVGSFQKGKRGSGKATGE